MVHGVYFNGSNTYKNLFQCKELYFGIFSLDPKAKKCRSIFRKKVVRVRLLANTAKLKLDLKFIKIGLKGVLKMSV